MIPERRIQVDLYYFLRVAISKGFKYEDIEFVDVKFEEPSINGRPDLVVFARERGKAPIPMLVIETKRKVPHIEPKFDPFSKDVIAQAERYATWLGAPYFATCNGHTLVLFKTFKVGVPLPQRRMKDYKVMYDEKFAEMLLEEVAKFRVGVGKWLPLDDVFVQRLRSFHRFITPFIHRALIEKLREDIKFKEEYVRWLKSQLFEYSDEMNEKIAEQNAYLLMNKIAFYKTLETQMPRLPELKTIEAVDGREFSGRLRQYFDKVLDVNYEAIFQKTILDEIYLPSRLMHALNDFIEELGTYNLAKIQSDVIGRVYEGLILGGERHRLGQYYTPPPIVELIVEMCIRSPNYKVLDPGCGSGSFLVKAYHKLKDLKKKENPFRGDAELHKELLNQVYGIDINPFPAQLSSINLAVRNLKVRSENINLVVSDFFKIKPGMPPLPPEFDVVVTNPPYTRQEEMEYKGKIRDIALTYSDGSKIDIDARAGIYAYFFTHSTKFLKNRGRTGYITSNSWLDVKFGEGLKEFFLDHFKIEFIIEHDAGVFETPVVDTCITILEKADGESLKQARDENVVKFVRVKKPMNIVDILDFIRTISVNHEDDKIKVVMTKQRELTSKEKWGKYLRAPSIYFKIVQHPNVTLLNKVADVNYGIKTGANEFFILDKEKRDIWGIKEEYLKPVINSLKDAKCIEFSQRDVSKHVLMVHDDKEKLTDENVLEYIKFGEEKGYPKRPSISGRKTWYDLGEKTAAPILFSEKLRRRVFFIWNKSGALAGKNLLEIRPKSKKLEDIVVLLGVLNSTLSILSVELQGRLYGGGMLDLQVYELAQLPILDPNRLKDDEKKRLKKAFLEICDAQRRCDAKFEERAKKELDDVIFRILGLTKKERNQVYVGLEYLRRMRRKRRRVGVLVETEAWKAVKKTKRKVKSSKEELSKRLDLWIR